MQNQAPNDNTFDLATPRRPGASDFNGIAKENATGTVADPQTDPSAEEWNTLCHVARAVGNVCALAILSIAGGASPSVTSVLAPGTNLVPSDFTVTRNAAGDLTIAWAVGKLPTKATERASVHSDVAIDSVRCFSVSSRSCRVKTSIGGVGTDCDLVVEIL